MIYEFWNLVATVTTALHLWDVQSYALDRMIEDAITNWTFVPYRKQQHRMVRTILLTALLAMLVCSAYAPWGSSHDFAPMHRTGPHGYCISVWVQLSQVPTALQAGWLLGPCGSARRYSCQHPITGNPIYLSRHGCVTP